MLSFYWWKGFFNYKMEFAGDFELYTLNKNQGDLYKRSERKTYRSLVNRVMFNK